MPGSTRIIGSCLSPYVRKVLACLEIKGVPYEIDPIIPFFGNDDFGRMSPLRRIPVLCDDAVTLSDSTLICEYLNERYPNPPLLPDDAPLRARARWFEEFADTRMGDALIWHFYYQLVVRRVVWKEDPQDDIVQKAREEEIPAVLDYLESELPVSGFLFGRLSIADITLASFFRTASYAGYAIDEARWPKTAGLVTRTLALPELEKLKKFEDVIMGTPVAERKSRLKAAGAPLVAESVGMKDPVRGIMPL